MATDSINIRCPSCRTEYELPGSFRQSLVGCAVTCASCSKPWVPTPASGWLARLRRPRELPIDLLPYQESAEVLLADSLSVPGTGGAPAAEAAGPDRKEPATEGAGPERRKPSPTDTDTDTDTDTGGRLSATGQAAPAVSPEAAAATVLDLAASMRPDTSMLTDNPMRGLAVEWVGAEAPYSGKRFRVTKARTVIGRTAGDMIIANERVSKKHAQLDVAGPGHYLLMDLASTNGTIVSGRRISTTGLRNGDVVSFGGVKFKFVVKTREGG